jgi:hypothetical protein
MLPAAGDGCKMTGRKNYDIVTKLFLAQQMG